MKMGQMRKRQVSRGGGSLADPGVTKAWSWMWRQSQRQQWEGRDLGLGGPAEELAPGYQEGLRPEEGASLSVWAKVARAG